MVVQKRKVTVDINECRTIVKRCDRRISTIVSLLEVQRAHPKDEAVKERLQSLHSKVERDLQTLAVWSDTPMNQRVGAGLHTYVAPTGPVKRRGRPPKHRPDPYKQRAPPPPPPPQPLPMFARGMPRGMPLMPRGMPGMPGMPGLPRGMPRGMPGMVPGMPPLQLTPAQQQQLALFQQQLMQNPAAAQALLQKQLQQLAKAGAAPGAAALKEVPRYRGPDVLEKCGDAISPLTEDWVLAMLHDGVSKKLSVAEAMVVKGKEGKFNCYLELTDGRNATWGAFADEAKARRAHVLAAFESGMTQLPAAEIGSVYGLSKESVDAVVRKVKPFEAPKAAKPAEAANAAEATKAADAAEGETGEADEAKEAAEAAEATEAEAPAEAKGAGESDAEAEDANAPAEDAAPTGGKPDAAVPERRAKRSMAAPPETPSPPSRPRRSASTQTPWVRKAKGGATPAAKARAAPTSAPPRTGAASAAETPQGAVTRRAASLRRTPPPLRRSARKASRK